MLGGLLKPDSGNIFFDKEDIVTYSPKELDTFRADAISFIFQQYCLFDELTVLENVKLVCPNSVGNDKANECLKLVGLEGYEKRRINELSGGQKQRVSIARALAKDARVILADEPTGALDKENSINLFSLLKDLSKDRLIIFSSHETEILKPFKPIVLNLENGELINKPKAFKETDQNVEKTKREPLSIKRMLKFGVSLFKKYGFRSSFASILLALTSALSIFGFSFHQYDTERAVQSMMVETGENSIVFTKHTRKLNTFFSSYTLDEIEAFRQHDDFVVLPCIDNFMVPLASRDLLYKNSKSIDKKDSRWGDIHSLCRYDSYVEKHYPIICGRKPNTSNEVLVSKTMFDMFKKYGFGTTIRNDEITSMESFLLLKPKFTFKQTDFEIVGIIDCSKYDTRDNYPDFTAKLSGGSRDYDYGYGIASPKNLIYVSPDVYSLFKQETQLNDVSYIKINDDNNDRIGYVSVLNENNFIEIDSNNPYGLSAYCIGKIIPISFTLPNSSMFLDYSRIYNFEYQKREQWEMGFSSIETLNKNLPIAKFSNINLTALQF